jgi:hypothetical protein
MQMGFWYLATPYSKYPLGIEQAFIDACKETALLLRAGVPIFSPIAYTHPIAIHGEINPLDHEVWLPADKPMMDAACGLIVCQMDTWDQSYGIGVEIQTFKVAKKPVIYMTPGIVPLRPKV